jgi:hypothetical protein
MGSIPIARSIKPDGSIGFTLLTYQNPTRRSQREGETAKGLKGRALPPTASRGNGNGLSSLAELAGKLK